MKLLLPVAVTLVFAPAALAAADGQLAFIRDNHVFIADSNAANPRQIDKDPREKADLHWDPFQKRISYFVGSYHNNELDRLVVIDFAGNQAAEASIRPGTESDLGLRFVEGLDWLPDGKARLWGSINPSNCEMFDFDVKTGQESNWQEGECGTFVASPDGRHIAALGLVQQLVSEKERFDTVQIDNREGLYGGGAADIFVLAGPVWSPDSQNIAVIEKRAHSGQAAVIILSLAGVATRIPVSSAILAHPALAWRKQGIIAGSGSRSIRIDPATRNVYPATPVDLAETRRLAVQRQQADALKTTADAAVERVGGKDAVILQ
jgi:hypothetical protein